MAPRSLPLAWQPSALSPPVGCRSRTQNWAVPTQKFCRLQARSPALHHLMDLSLRLSPSSPWPVPPPGQAACLDLQCQLCLLLPPPPL